MDEQIVVYVFAPRLVLKESSQCSTSTDYKSTRQSIEIILIYCEKLQFDVSPRTNRLDASSRRVLLWQSTSSPG